MNPYLQEYDDDDSPSFNTYSTNTDIAQIASRVVAVTLNNNGNNDDGGNDDEFEFGLAGNTSQDSFPVYPVFNRDLLRDLGSSDQTTKAIQLRELFDEDDSTLSADLEGVSPDTYCLWAPKSPSLSPSPSPGRCMKSSSTGSGPSPTVSKTWRLRNLLRRSKSDGKEGLMLVKNVKDKSSASSSSSSRPPSSPRRKSYLPYKQDLVGFFGSPQTLRRINIPPF
ncbi:uncharacterized protein LOC141586462 [Silene latifolia]|uniref:uncharacterized protein LOC141586462 n=1 Tax=Silene latifolia TaxID=37657 RepID=UPI003D78A384